MKSILLFILFWLLILTEPVFSQGDFNPGKLVRMDPDYQNVVIPPNIAPMNFRVLTEGASYKLQLKSSQGKPIVLQNKSGLFQFSEDAWHQMLQANKGEKLYYEITIYDRYRSPVLQSTITNSIAKEEIDGYLVYRLLNWQFSTYSSGTIGIFQRNLANFDEIRIFQAKDRTGGEGTCVNCHSFARNNPNPMVIHVRNATYGKPMLVAKNGTVTHFDKTGGLLAWHPDGRLLTYAVNKFSLLIHTAGRSNDIFDGGGDLYLLDVDSNEIITSEKISSPDFLETWPAWSPDGRYLYFCRTPKISSERFREIKYDLVRISYDTASKKWGELETVLTAKETGMSIGQPRISPDGRYLMFCLFAYGSSQGTQPESDLFLLDLTTRKFNPLTIANSDRTESWHCWSSNGRWFVFSSKRRDGLLTRPHISYFDSSGNAHKPFIVPQKDPSIYDTTLKMYNLPELITGPVPVDFRDFYNALFHPQHKVVPTGQVVDKQLQSTHQDEGSPHLSPYGRAKN